VSEVMIPQVPPPIDLPQPWLQVKITQSRFTHTKRDTRKGMQTLDSTKATLRVKFIFIQMQRKFSEGALTFLMYASVERFTNSKKSTLFVASEKERSAPGKIFQKFLLQRKMRKILDYAKMSCGFKKIVEPFEKFQNILENKSSRV